MNRRASALLAMSLIGMSGGGGYDGRAAAPPIPTGGKPRRLTQSGSTQPDRELDTRQSRRRRARAEKSVRREGGK